MHTISTARHKQELKLNLLGKPNAVLPDGEVVALPLDTSLLIVSYLSVNPGRCYSRADLAAMLYPDHDDRRAGQNVRQIIRRLRKLLRDDEREKPGLLVDNTTIRVNPVGQLVSDVHQFFTAYQAVQTFTSTHSHRRLEICRTCKKQFEHLAALYLGDFLDGFIPKTDSALDDWVYEIRQECIKKICVVYHWLAKYDYEYQQFEACGDHLNRILKYDPLDEAAVRLTMQILHQSGKRNQALLHFHDFQSRLQKTLNIGAEEETLLQAQTIRASACDRDGGAPPLTEKALFSHQDINHSLLPDASLPFFNRGDEIECVVDLLESREHRVIVLKGVIGAGKTRLAMQVAERVKRTWTDHVHMVMINHHQHPNLVSAMIQALGIPSANSSDHRKNLIQYLRNKESLIILDNLGELPDQADVILSLAYQCPKVKFIATTHRHLGIRGEQVIQVNGLAHPRPADVPEFQSDQEREAFIHQYSALALFYEVARRAKAGFAVDAGELRAVVDICDMLMGLPLAIEMAASFVRIFNGYQIRDGVYGCLHGNRDMAVFVAGRQGSFVKRFEAVWNTLSPVERELIKRINQFADGVDTRQLLEDRAGSFETLIGLLDKSALISLPDQRVKLHPLTRFFACP